MYKPVVAGLILNNKKVNKSQDIVFMQEKTIADWETEKKGSFSESTDKEQLEEISINPVRSQMLFDDQSRPAEPARFRLATESTEEELDIGS